MALRFDRLARLLLRATGAILRDRGESVAIRERLGYTSELLRPRSFNARIGRTNLGRPPRLWTELADGVRIRDHVAAAIGDGYSRRLYGVATDYREIGWPELPQRVVFSASHGPGWVHAIDDTARIDETALSALTSKWLGMRYGQCTNESWYDDIPPRILVEEYLHDGRWGYPLEYKIWTFGSCARFIQVDFPRGGDRARTFYDPDWRRQSWGHDPRYPPGPRLDRPKPLRRMLEIAESLTFGAPFAGVDLHCIDDSRIVVRGIDFAPGAGRTPFWPDRRIDLMLGSVWPPPGKWRSA